MKLVPAWLGGMLVLPVLGIAGFEIFRFHSPPPPRALRAGAATPTPAIPVAAPAIRPRTDALVPRSVPRAPAAPPRITTPPSEAVRESTTEAELKWRNEREGGELAALRQSNVTQFFQNEEAAGALKAIACRETMCRLTLDNSMLTADERLRITALRLGQGSTILRNEPEEIVALVPFQTIETLTRRQ